MSHIRERECSERAESREQRKLLIMFVKTKIIPKKEVTLELNIHFSSWWCTKNCNSRLWLPSVGLLCQSWMTRTELCKAAERHGRDVQSTGKSAQLCCSPAQLAISWLARLDCVLTGWWPAHTTRNTPMSNVSMRKMDKNVSKLRCKWFLYIFNYVQNDHQ